MSSLRENHGHHRLSLLFRIPLVALAVLVLALALALALVVVVAVVVVHVHGKENDSGECLEHIPVLSFFALLATSLNAPYQDLQYVLIKCCCEI